MGKHSTSARIGKKKREVCRVPKSQRSKHVQGATRSDLQRWDFDLKLCPGATVRTNSRVDLFKLVAIFFYNDLGPFQKATGW